MNQPRQCRSCDGSWFKRAGHFQGMNNKMEDVSESNKFSERTGERSTNVPGPGPKRRRKRRGRNRNSRNSKPQRQATAKEESGVEEEDKPRQTDLLLKLASAGELFHTADNEAYVTVPAKAHRETWPVDSRQFRLWLRNEFFTTEQKAVHPNVLKTVAQTLEAQAIFQGETNEAHTHVAHKSGQCFLDLCNDKWEAVRITPTGWQLTANPPVKFRRAPGAEPLPRPQRGGSINELKKFLNVSPEDFKLVVGFLLGALMPKGPYPILVLVGEQGTAKSTASRVIRKVIDPNKASARSPSKDEKALVIAATNSWIVSFDNVSNLHNWFSDALCRIATGEGFGDRSLYTNSEETLMSVSRPIILNGIGDFATRSDLLSRSIILRLPPIDEGKRREEEDFWLEFDGRWPRILGALLDAACSALGTYKSIKLDKRPRMADFARWVTAAEGALGWGEGEFLRIYMKNIAQSNAIALEASPVGLAVLAFMAQKTEWEGSAESLLAQLGPLVQPSVIRRSSWPSAGNVLSRQLTRLAPNLSEVGISVARGKRKDRYIRLEREGNGDGSARD